MPTPMRFLLLVGICGNVFVSAIKSFRIDEPVAGKLIADGPESAVGGPLAVIADSTRHPVLKLQPVADQKQSSTTAQEEEAWWVSWWLPHITFFRAFLAMFLAILMLMFSPSKFGQKCVCMYKAMSLWKKAPQKAEPAEPVLPAIPETPNVDNLEGELLERACFAEAIAKKQVAAFFDTEAKRMKKRRLPRKESLVSSDEEDMDDPDPPLRPGAEAPFTFLFSGDCEETTQRQERGPFSLLMADENFRPAADTIHAPMESYDFKTTISAKKFKHSQLKKARSDGEKKEISTSSSCSQV